MQLEEQNLLTSLRTLADCLKASDSSWSGMLSQAADEGETLLSTDADLIRKFDFVCTHNYSTGGMGSLNDGVVPETCTPYQRNLYRSIKDLLRIYWKQLGRECHEYSDFAIIPEGAKVRLVPGTTIFLDSINSSETPKDEAPERSWTVLCCDGPDITGMPSYSIRRGNHFRSARHEALEIADEKKSLLQRIFG